jgi:hypothetical protein
MILLPNMADPGDSSRANQEHNSSLVLDAAERFLRGKTPLWYHGKDKLRSRRDVFTSNCRLAGLLSYLRYLWLFVHSGVQHIFCCVLLCFHRLVYLMLPDSLVDSTRMDLLKVILWPENRRYNGNEKLCITMDHLRSLITNCCSF